MMQIGQRPSLGVGRRLLIALLTTGLVLVLAGIARGDSLGWSAEVPPESTGGSAIRADALACPSRNQCTAVDTQGQESTFDPQRPTLPEPVEIDWGSDLSGIACPSTSQCTAVDNHGNEFTFNPQEPAALTSRRTSPVSLSDVACVSASNCVAVGNPQDTAVVFDPLEAAESINLPLEEIDGLGSVSCPTISQCTATTLGNEITFDPLETGASEHPQELVPLDSGGRIRGVVCPTSSQCTAVEDEGAAITFDPSSPLTREIVPIGIYSRGVACPSSEQCTAAGEAEAVTFDPLDPGSALIPNGSGEFSGAVACPSLTQCTIVAGDEETTFDPQQPQEFSVARPARSLIRSSSGSVLHVSHGRTAISLHCAGQSACQIEITLVNGRPGGAAEASRGIGSLAQTRRRIPAHQSRRISIALTRFGLGQLRVHRGRIAARLVIDGMAGVAPINLNRAVLLTVGSVSR
jgi:hypothetical protein